MSTTTIDTDAIVWRPFTCTLETHMAEQAVHHAWEFAEGHGLGVFDDRKPDHWSRLDCDRYAFRIENHGHPAKHTAVCVIVTMDYDSDGERDLSKCTRIEIVRCKSQQEERAAVAADPRA